MPIRFCLHTLLEMVGPALQRNSFAQITLSGSSYSQNFDGTTLPSGWSTKIFHNTARMLEFYLKHFQYMVAVHGEFRFAPHKTTVNNRGNTAAQNA